MENANQRIQSNQKISSPVNQALDTVTSQDSPIGKEEKSRELVKALAYVLASILLVTCGVFELWFYQKKIAKKTTVLPPPAVSEPTTISSPEIKRKAIIPENWKIFSSKTLMLEFALPPELYSQGDLIEKTMPGESGNMLCITYYPKRTSSIIKPVMAGGAICQINTFGLSAPSIDFQEGREAGFSDLQGYIVEAGKYYAILPLMKKVEIPNELVEVIDNPNGIKILKVTGKNLTSEVWQGPIAGTPGEGWVGALLNISNSQSYRGFTVSMKLTPKLTEEVFMKILSTFRFLGPSEELTNQIEIMEKTPLLPK